MIRTQVSFEERMYREAQAEARRRGISFAELCRRAMAGVLRSRSGERPWMRYAGIVQSGDPDASRTVDQVVYVRETP
jgi:hypothetical protein